MKKFLFTQLTLVVSTLCFGQTFDSKVLTNQDLENVIKSINANKNINTDSAFSLLTAFNEYPVIEKTDKEYLFFYNDSIFGEVPVRVFIPKTYSNKYPFGMILLLHGAVGIGRFSNIDKSSMTYRVEGIDYTNSDGFYDYLCKQNFIVVNPVSDPTRKFNWGWNQFKPEPNPTFNTLIDILIRLKQFLNIDDNRVFAYGHSDGSDGAFALNMYKPSLFAGFIGYNSMLKHMDGQTYLSNMINKPFYLVHSDLDDLRPIQQTRSQVRILDSIKAPVLYKEYIGYEHEDKHLQIDRPYSLIFLKTISRNSFPKEIYWETDNDTFNRCSWLQITSLNTSLEKASWQKELNVPMYNKITKQFMNEFSYRNILKSGAVRAYYDNNSFDIETSRVDQIELLISPLMVNLQNSIVVTINGKVVFNKKIDADKTFLLNDFKKNFDRHALWVTSIKLKIE